VGTVDAAEDEQCSDLQVRLRVRFRMPPPEAHASVLGCGVATASGSPSRCLSGDTGVHRITSLPEVLDPDSQPGRRSSSNRSCATTARR